MFCLNVWLTVKQAGDVETVRDLLRQAGEWTREEPGCARFEVYHSQSDPTKFLLCEQWASEADWQTHRTAWAFTEIYAPQVLPLVNREPHPSTLVG